VGPKSSTLKSCSRIALPWMARSARGDVRWVAAVFVGAVERKSVVPPSPPADRRREHRESAVVVVARRRKNTSARSSSVRRRAIPDARTSVKELLAHRALLDARSARGDVR
jgi:hypothetical protein